MSSDTDRMKRIDAAQSTADAERLALIADTIEENGHARASGLKVYWARGPESGLPMSETLILIHPDGNETVLGTELPGPAQQELLALLESRFDSTLEGGQMTFDLQATPTAPGRTPPGGMNTTDLELLREVAADLEEQERAQALSQMLEPDHTRSGALRALIARLAQGDAV